MSPLAAGQGSTGTTLTAVTAGAVLAGLTVAMTRSLAHLHRCLHHLEAAGGPDAHQPFYKQLPSGHDGAAVFRHAVNAGSVGKPKDGDPRACYVLLEFADDPRPADSDAVKIVFRRVPYDVERAARAVEDTPLPDEYALVLRTAH